MPIKVLKREKYEIREMSKGEKSLAKESGITGRFDMNAVNPYSFTSDEFFKAIERSQNQSIPETA